MTNPSKIDARKSKAKNMDNDANMEPKLRSNSIKNKWKNDTKNITRNDAKMKRPEAIGLEGDRAQSAGWGKEFLRSI